MTDSDEDAPEWSADVFERAEIKRGGEVLRPASGTLTKPHESMLERAARAACVADGHNPDGPTCDIYIHDDPDAGKPWASYRSIARAVLMAVRVPSGAVLEAAEFSPDNEWDRDHFTAMIDAILNETPE